MSRDPHATAKLHRAWLQGLPAYSGKSLTRIAQEIGVAKTTLTRPLKADDPGTSTLHADTIKKIVENTGYPPPGADPHETGWAKRAGLAEDAMPYVVEAGGSVSAAVQALTGGVAGIDPWIMRSGALELLGFLPGDIVLVDLTATPKPGDTVCAQVYDWQRMKAETVMRVYERAAPVDLLLARSRDSSLQPIVVDGERVIVKGVILPHRLRAAEPAIAAPEHEPHQCDGQQPADQDHHLQLVPSVRGHLAGHREGDLGLAGVAEKHFSIIIATAMFHV